MQAEEAEGNKDWANAERMYAEATFIDTSASLINTALWLGLCRTRWHMQLSQSSVEACEQTLSLQPDNVEAIKYKVRSAAVLLSTLSVSECQHTHGFPCYTMGCSI